MGQTVSCTSCGEECVDQAINNAHSTYNINVDETSPYLPTLLTSKWMPPGLKETAEEDCCMMLDGRDACQEPQAHARAEPDCLDVDIEVLAAEAPCEQKPPRLSPTASDAPTADGTKDTLLVTGGSFSTAAPRSRDGSEASETAHPALGGILSVLEEDEMSSSAVSSTPVPGSSSDRAGALQLVEKRRKERQAERRAALLQVKPFLAQHGFETIQSRRWRLNGFSTPLHLAVRENDADLVRLMLKAGANPLAVDSFNRSALELACKKDHQGSHADVLAAFRPMSLRGSA